MVAWALLLALLALVAVADCVARRQAHRCGPHGLLLLVGVASLILAVLVVPEFMANVQTDLVSFAGSSWGTIVGLGLTVLAAIGAWFAWATVKFPHLWGIEPGSD
jgi:predicted transporter